MMLWTVEPFDRIFPNSVSQTVTMDTVFAFCFYDGTGFDYLFGLILDLVIFFVGTIFYFL